MDEDIYTSQNIFFQFLFVNGIGRENDLEVAMRNTDHTSRVGNLKAMGQKTYHLRELQGNHCG